MFCVNIRYDTFYNIQEIYNFCKTLPFYNLEQYRQKFPNLQGKETIWPGYRTEEFKTICPIFYHFILEKLIESKIDIKQYRDISTTCHLRLESDNEGEYIHTDPSDTALVYLSPTNFSSGTNFYDDRRNLVTHCAFLQNTMTNFSQGILHSSVNNYGNSIENGRMTINIFMMKKVI